MLNKETFLKHAMALYDFCEYPAVRYKILFSLLDTPYEDESLSRLRGEFLHSDIVEEMYQTQGENGGWGRLRSKDYSVKAKIPTSEVGIERCLYIGLTLEDRDILFMAREYLLSLLDGTAPEGMFEKNQRANPWQTALVCSLLEDISPYSEESDDTYNCWLYIAQRAYGSGEYSYEEDQAAQHEVFSTREKQLVPMQSGLLLSAGTGFHLSWRQPCSVIWEVPLMRRAISGPVRPESCLRVLEIGRREDGLKPLTISISFGDPGCIWSFLKKYMENQEQPASPNNSF